MILLAGLSMLAACGRRSSDTGGTSARARGTSVFSYDPAEFAGAKPWTSEGRSDGLMARVILMLEWTTR
jgi:hypothetical protein